MKTLNKSEKSGTPILFVATTLMAVLLIGLSVSRLATASESKISRKWGSFELGTNLKDLTRELTFFTCRALNSETHECKLIGYPQRDDFVVLKFYQEKLVAMAEFRASADWEKTLSNLKEQLGDPTLPNYQSDRAVAYIWEDTRKYITLTHLIKLGYTIYEIRDRVMEPLYRKSVAASKQK